MQTENRSVQIKVRATPTTRRRLDELQAFYDAQRSEGQRRVSEADIIEELINQKWQALHEEQTAASPILQAELQQMRNQAQMAQALGITVDELRKQIDPQRNGRPTMRHAQGLLYSIDDASGYYFDEDAYANNVRTWECVHNRGGHYMHRQTVANTAFFVCGVCGFIQNIGEE